MAVKKFTRTKTLSCSHCKKRRKFVLISSSVFFWTWKYECTFCWDTKVIS